MLDNIASSVAIVDLRNYTRLFELYSEKKDNSFNEFLKEYYHLGMYFVDVASFNSEYYINTTGDGFLVIFFGENHEVAAYLYGLLLFKAITKICNKFNENQPEKVSFGIGIDSGDVKKISVSHANRYIDTYLGSVINIAARIESTTKSFNHTNLIIGNGLYTRLIKLLYKDAYENIVKNSDIKRKNYDEIMSHHNEINMLNQRLMLFYIFEHNLKGVNIPIPLFRLSPTLASSKRERYNTVIRKLCLSEKQFEYVMKEINTYL